MNLPAKAELRTLVRARVAALSPPARAAASAALREHLQALPAWRSARTVLLYIPLHDEPDLLPLLTTALAAGRTVTLPAFDRVAGSYEFRRILAPERDLVPGQFLVPEPAAHCPQVPAAALDFAAVPGVAFAPDGSRLGRGKGFYDRMLAPLRAVTCGVGFDEQLVPRMPVEPHDVKLHYVVTPTRLLDCRAEAR